MKKQNLQEEMKDPRKIRRELSADDNLVRNPLADRKSGAGDILLAGQYGTRKKTLDLDEQDNLIEKCMLSQPNKYTLEQIKKQNAYVWSFGQNTKGELGVGHYNEVLMPERVRGLPKMKIVHLSSGAKHTGAVSEDGRLWMCGSNLHDKLGLEGITTGSKKSFKPVELLSHVKILQVACGDYHTMCLSSEGQVFVWGGSLHNKRGDRSEERKSVPKYKPMPLKALERKVITHIDCGDFHSLALEDNGTLYSWGLGEKGECGHGKFEDMETPQRIKFFDGKTIVQIVAGNHHTLALTSDNQLYAWGDGRFGQCGYGEYENTSIPQVINFPSTAQSNSMYIDDSVHQEIMEFFKEPPKIKQIAAGEMHSIVLGANGQIWTFGYNSQGQLGHNNTENYCRPKLVEGMLTHKIVGIAAGRNHSLALTTKNDVYACGNGTNGQLGLPDKEMRKTFTHVLSLMSVNSCRLHAGGLHSWVILDDIMPKKDEFQTLRMGGKDGSNDDSLLNSRDDDTINQFTSQLDIGGKSEASNWNLFNEQQKHSKYAIQVNYTDTALSHRFIRFELNDSASEIGKAKVEEFIRQMYKDEGGTIYHRLQEDQDIVGERGQVVAPGRGKYGRFFTLQIVTDISKNEDTVEPKRELVKNRFDFIDEVYDVYIRHNIGVIGSQPQKTSIGVQVMMRDYEININEYEKKLALWASLFSKSMTKLCSSRIKYFELRPYSYAPI